MGTLPEGWIKEIVKEMLNAHPGAYYYMPVQNGMGASTLDFICAINGRYVAIEAKAPGKYMTDRQEQVAIKMEVAGAEVIRDVGTNWESIQLLWNSINRPLLIEMTTILKARWERWYENAGGSVC